MVGAGWAGKCQGDSALLAPGTLPSLTIPTLVLCKLFSPTMRQRREELALHFTFNLF